MGDYVPPPPQHTPQKCQNKETSKQNKWEGNITRFMNDLFFISKIEKKKIVNETFIIDFLYMVSVYANLIRVPDECKEKGVFLYADNA